MVTITAYLVMRMVHQVIAGVWVGATVFMAVLFIPIVRNDHISADGVIWTTNWFGRFSKFAPILMVLTGLYMLSQRYATEALFASVHGVLIVTMILLWIVLSALTNVGSHRLSSRSGTGDVATAAGDVSLIFYGAGVVSLALLCIGGWL